MIDYAILPVHMRHGMRCYIEEHVPVGDFLTAVLSNDFMRACACADDINKDYLFMYAYFLHNYAPPACYGSPEAVRNWIKKDGRHEI